MQSVTGREQVLYSLESRFLNLDIQHGDQARRFFSLKIQHLA